MTRHFLYRRREFIKLFGSTLIAWPVAVWAQQRITKIPRIGWVVTGSPTSHRFSLAAFREGLKALGYVEGHNISIEYRWAEGNLTRLPELANDLVQQKVDIILAGGTTVAEVVKRTTSTIPVVVAGASDLAELGLVASLARPGGNLTGFVATAPEAAAKRLEIMRDIKPQARRATVLANLSSNNAKLEFGFVKQFASANDFAITPYDAHEVEELKRVLTNIPQSNADVLVVLNDPFVFTYRKLIVEAANEQQLPGVYGFREFVDDGGFVSYGAQLTETYRGAARYLDQILRGAKPADLPVQLPTKFELIVNLKTAKALGLTISRDFLLRADEMIE
jgi:putative ABC transport system substrate-binding protein